MPNASYGYSVAATAFVFFILALQFPSPNQMIIRLHANSLDDLAGMTRHWMNASLHRHFPLRSHSKHLAHRLGQGRLQLHNLSVVDFFPPDVHFHPSHNSLLYLTTDGGTSLIDAQWSLQSDFLLSMIRSPAFAGSVRAKISGFSADVSIKIAQKSNLVIHQCISRFDNFQLQFGGSIAADLIHWFHRPLAQAMQSHVEETYCQMIGEKLLPWLREQLGRLAMKLHIDFGADLELTQWLQWVQSGENYLDLGMAQKLKQKGTTQSREKILAEITPWDSPKENMGMNNGNDWNKSVEFFLPEHTLQQVFSGAHHSKQFHANFSSPFFRTSCPFLCLGKLVPKMRSTLGPVHLLAVVRTNDPPNVRLFQHRIRLKINVSFELFEHWKMDLEEHVVRPKEELEEIIMAKNYDLGMEEEEKSGEQGNLEDEEENGGRIEQFAEEVYSGEEQKEEGTLIRPKFIGVNGPAAGRHKQTNGMTMTPTMSTIVFTAKTTDSGVSDEKGEEFETTTFGHPLVTFPSSERPKPAPNNNNWRHEPVLRIVLDTELEILLVLDRRRRKLKTELSLSKVRAVMAQSQIQDLSQKTLDLLMEASIPFLENSIKILYRDGLELDNILSMPTKNESVQVEEGFIRYSADINLARLLQ